MDVYKNSLGAALYIEKKLKFKYFGNRARDMIRQVCLKPSRDGSTPMEYYSVKIDHVCPSWPSSGSIMVIRDDRKRFRLYMTKTEFKIKHII